MRNKVTFVAQLPLAGGFAALALLLFAPETVHAQTDVLFACHVPNSGVVYRVNAPDAPGENPTLKDSCTGKKHVLFSWNQQGPQGPEGPEGPEGPPGPGVDWVDITADRDAFDTNCEYRFLNTTRQMFYPTVVRPDFIGTTLPFGPGILVERSNKGQRLLGVQRTRASVTTFRRCPSL